MSKALFKHIPPTGYRQFVSSMEGHLLGMGVAQDAVDQINSRLGECDKAAFPLDTRGRQFSASVGGARLVMDRMWLCVSAEKSGKFSASIVGEVVEERYGV